MTEHNKTISDWRHMLSLKCQIHSVWSLLKPGEVTQSVDGVREFVREFGPDIKPLSPGQRDEDYQYSRCGVIQTDMSPDKLTECLRSSPVTDKSIFAGIDYDMHTQWLLWPVLFEYTKPESDDDEGVFAERALICLYKREWIYRLDKRESVVNPNPNYFFSVSLFTDNDVLCESLGNWILTQTGDRASTLDVRCNLRPALWQLENMESIK